MATYTERIEAINDKVVIAKTAINNAFQNIGFDISTPNETWQQYADWIRAELEHQTSEDPNLLYTWYMGTYPDLNSLVNDSWSVPSTPSPVFYQADVANRSSYGWGPSNSGRSSYLYRNIRAIPVALQPLTSYKIVADCYIDRVNELQVSPYTFWFGLSSSAPNLSELNPYIVPSNNFNQWRSYEYEFATGLSIPKVQNMYLGRDINNYIHLYVYRFRLYIVP